MSTKMNQADYFSLLAKKLGGSAEGEKEKKKREKKEKKKVSLANA